MTEHVVRLATPEDEPALVAMCQLLHTENGLYPLSMEKVHRVLGRAFNREGAIIGVIGDVGAPIASIYLELSESIYSDTWQLLEQWSYVHPDHRRSDCAKKLLEYAKHCSDELKMPLSIGILSNHRTEAKIRLYERHLEKAGAYFIYNRQYAGPSAWDEQR